MKEKIEITKGLDKVVKRLDKIIKEAPEYIQKTGNYIYENKEGIASLAIAAYYAYFLISDMHYKSLKNKLVKAEIKSKTAYAKNFGIK